MYRVVGIILVGAALAALGFGCQDDANKPDAAENSATSVNTSEPKSTGTTIEDKQAPSEASPKKSESETETQAKNKAEGAPPARSETIQAKGSQESKPESTENQPTPRERPSAPKTEEEILKRAASLATARKGASAQPPTPPSVEALPARPKSTPAVAAARPQAVGNSPGATPAVTSTPGERAQSASRVRPLTKPPVPIAHALKAQELKELTGITFKPSLLDGQLPSPRYNSLYFKNGRGEKLGVAVQLWHEPALKDTRARYEQMKISFPNAQETGNITKYTFFFL